MKRNHIKEHRKEIKMIDVKVIMEERRDNFESEIKKYLENGYKIQASNLTAINTINSTLKGLTKDYKTILTKDNVYKFCFYALLIKE